MYLEPVPPEALPAASLLKLPGPVTAERFCDNDGGYQRKYNVYKLTANGKSQVLKKSDRDDIATLVSLVGLIIVLTVVISMIADLFSQIRQLFDIF